MPEKNYEVGYGKPPKEHQFKKGRSGNPKGRPRKPRPNADLRDIFERLDQETLEVQGTPMTYREIEIRSLARKAAKGDVTASRHLDKLRKDVGIDEVKAEKRGVLVVPGLASFEEFQEAALKQQKKWREQTDAVSSDEIDRK